MLHIDLIRLVCEYTPYYRLMGWIKPSKLCPKNLSSNPNAIDFLMEHPEFIIYPEIYANCGTNLFILQDWNKIINLPVDYNPNWTHISKNICAIDIIEQNLDKCDFRALSGNKMAMHVLEKYAYLINIEYLCDNTNAIHIIKDIIKIGHGGLLNWDRLCGNPNAVNIVLNSLQRTEEGHLVNNRYNNRCLTLLSANPAIWETLVKDSLDKINWVIASSNPKAIHQLKLREQLIDWQNLSTNPGIFEPIFNKKLYLSLLNVM